LALIVVSLAAAGPGRAQDLCDGKAAELRKAIEAHGAKWVSRPPSAAPTMTGLEQAPIEAPVLPLTEAAETILPKRYDWREHHAVSGVRDQGQCGSCWAFSMTQALESQVMIASKSSEDPKLSEQVMVSCSGVGSCNGGKMNASFIQTVGLPPESDYPYTATDGSCSAAKSGWRQRAHRIGSWYSVPHNLAAVKSALVIHGPLPITLDLRKDMKYYESGVYTYIKGDDWGCGGKDSSGRDNDEWGWHAVLLVGYDDAEQYFIVKNSWGTGWGENGYFRIAYSEMSTKAFFGNETLVYLTTPPGAAEVAAASRATKKTSATASRPDAAAAVADVLPGSVLGSTAESGAGGPQCTWTPPSCGVCACGSSCLYCKADPSIAACGGAQPHCPVPKMVTGLQLRAEPETLSSDSPVTLTAVLSFSESVTPQEKQQVSVEFSAAGAGAASVGFGAASASGSFKANADSNGTVQVPVHLIPSVAADAPKNADEPKPEEKEDQGPNSEIKKNAGAAFDALDAEVEKSKQKPESAATVGEPAPLHLSGVVMLPPGLVAAPSARLSQAVDVKVKTKTEECKNLPSLAVSPKKAALLVASKGGSSQSFVAELAAGWKNCESTIEWTMAPGGLGSLSPSTGKESAFTPGDTSGSVDITAKETSSGKSDTAVVKIIRCSQEEHDQLNRRMHSICDQSHACPDSQAAANLVSCEDLITAEGVFSACIAARQAVINACFKDNPDPNHVKQIVDETKGLLRCQRVIQGHTPPCP